MNRTFLLPLLLILSASLSSPAHAQLPTELIQSNKVIARHIAEVLGLPQANRLDNEFTVSTNVPSPGYVHHPVEDLITYIGYDKLNPVPGNLSYYELVDPREVTVTFADGGNFGPISNEFGSVDSELYVYNHSHVIVDGGSIAGFVGLDDSTLKVVRGSVERVGAHKESQIELEAAGDVGEIRLFGKSKLLANDGIIRDLFVSDNTSAILNDVFLADARVYASGAAGVEISSLTIMNYLFASGSAHVSLTGTEPSSVSAVDDSAVEITDGDVFDPIVHVEVGDRASLQLHSTDAQDVLVIQSGKFSPVNSHVQNLRAQGSAVVTSLGTIFDSLVARQNATVRLSGGSTLQADAYDSSTFDFTDVSVDGYASVHGGTFEMYQGEINGEFHVGGANLPSVATLSEVKEIFGEVTVIGPKSKLSAAGSTFFSEDISAFSNAEVTLAGVSVNTINSLSESVVEISNTTVRNAGIAANGGIFFMKSGHIKNDFMAIGPGSTVVLEGGAVDRNLVGIGGALVTMTGGFVAGKTYIDEASTFNFLGGTILGDLFAILPPDDGGDDGSAGESIVSRLLSAGSAAGGFDPLAGKIVASAGSIVNIYGTDLSTLLVDSNYVDPDSGNVFTIYELFGMLADGSPLAGQLMFIQNDTETTFNLLPPPRPRTNDTGAGGSSGRAGGCRKTLPIAADDRRFTVESTLRDRLMTRRPISPSLPPPKMLIIPRRILSIFA